MSATRLWHRAWTHAERTTMTPADRANVIARAEHGLRFAAEVQSIPLHGFDLPRVARTIYAHVTNGPELVDWSDHQRAIADARAETERWKRAWAREQVETDQLLGRVQRALSALDNRGLAQRLAGQIGVLLLPDGDSAPEAEPARGDVIEP